LHSTQRKKYFRWKEDICAFIETHWEGLLPTKQRGANWQNSVSSVLSSHGEVFKNGFEDMSEQGWWALRAIEPPFMYPQQKKSIKLEPIFSSPNPSNSNSNNNKIVDEELRRELLRKLLSEDKSILTKALNPLPPPSQKSSSNPNSPAVKSNPITANRYLPISEADVLRRCLQIPPPQPPPVRRLMRKIITRRARRKLGLPLFDLDQFIYEYLKSEVPLYLGEPPHNCAPGGSVIPSMEQQMAAKYQSKVPVELTFRAKMHGLCNVVEEWPTPLVSPFTGHTLPGVLTTLPNIKPPQYRLFQELHSLANNHPDLEPIKVCYIRKELIGQINVLLREAFWPRIDITEYLETPDYCVCALHKLRVVSVAIMTPEGNLDYLWTAPGWHSSHLARTLLYLLIRRCPARDITLHVAPDNYAAMRVYQELGFKVDRFVLGFYEKYLPADQPGTRNAFFMRLRK
jgi:GNAT superfamily N-acetyltransferase